jgi:hypothetical protein
MVDTVVSVYNAVNWVVSGVDFRVVCFAEMVLEYIAVISRFGSVPPSRSKVMKNMETAHQTVERMHHIETRNLEINSVITWCRNKESRVHLRSSISSFLGGPVILISWSPCIASFFFRKEEKSTCTMISARIKTAIGDRESSHPSAVIPNYDRFPCSARQCTETLHGPARGHILSRRSENSDSPRTTSHVSQGDA